MECYYLSLILPSYELLLHFHDAHCFISNSNILLLLSLTLTLSQCHSEFQLRSERTFSYLMANLDLTSILMPNTIPLNSLNHWSLNHSRLVYQCLVSRI
jgi:hypothetical protein